MSVKRTSHAVYNINYHFVWAPKYRQSILFGKLESRIKELFLEIAQQYDFDIEVQEMNLDHVHLFVSAPPRFSPAQLVERLKSISSRIIFKEFPDLKKKLWAGQLWSDGYYVGTSGDKITNETIKKYIKQQKQQKLNLFFG